MKAKTIILSLSFVFLCIYSHAQTNVAYTYDSAGNRASRSIVVSKGEDAGWEEDSAIELAERIDTTAFKVAADKESVYDILSRIHYRDPQADRDYHTFYERVLAGCSKGRSRNSGIDTTCAIGRIPLTSGTTPTGAKTYSIAVPTAAGFHLTPSISLDYSSQAGDGPAGYGWSIGGLSSISIRNKSSYYDDTIAPADINDGTAAYCLDGVPLVTNDITDLYSSGYTLQTTRGFIVVKKNVSGGVVTHFTALFPDGSRATYGWTSNSQNLVSYPITEKTDIHGNKITFHYRPASSPSQHRRVYEIHYGFNSSGTYQGKISFSYSQRSDISTVFRAGANVTDKWLLKGIASYSYNGTSYDKICQYNLNHTLLEGVNQLTRVEASSDGSQLNPVRFEYNSQEQSRSFNESLEEDIVGQLSSFYSDTTDSYIYKRGKFVLGDFTDGIMIYPDREQYDPTQSLLVAPVVDTTYTTSIPVNWFTAGSGFKTLEAADANGDGRDELIKLNFGVSGNKTQLTITKYNYTGSSPNPWAALSLSVLLQGVINDGGTYKPAPRDCFFGDFDGDGKTELITISHRDLSQGLATSYYALIDLEYLMLVSEGSNLFSYPTTTDYKIVPIDTDGDGRTELCSFSSGGDMRLYNSTATSLSLTKTITCGDIHIFDNHGPHFADINGDGYMDLVRIDTYSPGTSTGDWSAYYYNGSSLQYTSEPEGTPLYGYEGILFMDLNRDGISDVLVLSGNYLRTGINRNNGVFDFSGASPMLVPSGFSIIPCSLKDYVLRSRFVSITQSGTVKTYNFTDDRSSERLVSNVTDSYGNKEYLLYRNMAEQKEVYGNDAYVPSLSWGYYRLIAPLNLLWQDDVVSGDITSSSSYEYSDLVANHRRGFGICGFAKVSEHDNINQICTKTEYDPERFGIVISVKDSLLVDPPGTLPRVTKTVSNTYTNINHTYRKLVPRLTGTVSTDALTGIISTQTISYTDYDLPSYVSERRRIGESGTQQVTSQSFTYENTTSYTRYILGSVTRKLSTSNIDGDGTFWKKQEDYTYNSIGQPVSIAYSEGPYNSGTTKTLEKHFTYDSHGKVLTEKSARYNSTSYYGWTYTYDSNGRYLTSKTDAIGLKTQYSNYDKFGNPQTVKDYNRNKTTTHTYDTWGNLVRTVHPDGSIDSVFRRWGGAGLYTIKTKSAGKPDRIVHYDALEREVRTGEIRFDGHWGYTDTRYNTRGQLDSVSLPYKDTTLTPTYWNIYSYDVYGRPTRKQNASGKVTNYSYSGTTTTTVVEGLTYYQVTDASGNVTQDRSYYGNVNYTYRDDGQLASISTTQQGQTITYSYDNLGRRVGTSDPNSGTRTTSYQWNSNGSSVVTETNPNGSIATSYDQYGRVTGINYPGRFSTSYTYNSLGELTGESSTNGLGKSYNYDGYGRLSYSLETGPDDCYFDKKYTYSSGGNISSIQYGNMDGYITTLIYNYQNGHNVGMSLPDYSKVIQIQSENALGQVTAAASGGDTDYTRVCRKYEYDAYGFPTRRAFGYLSSYSAVIGPVYTYFTDESYSFNHNTGNLQSRNSLRFGETFSYDLVNRLYGNTSSNYWYGINGNITWRNDGGQQTFQATGSDGYKLTSLRARTDSLVAPRSQTISYTGFDRPDVITEGDRTCRFTYDAARNRVRTVIAEGDSTILKRWYAGGNYERDSTAAGITERIYLGGDAYSAPAVLVRRTNHPDTFFSIGRDYQGSITYLRSKDGQESYEYNYDPWGNVRYADNDTIPLTYKQVPELFLGRGYTGHEHLPYFGLINMNARLYDPITTRFLSPDPFVQAPHDFQNYNRYSYCLNNPLKYTDESGEFAVTTMLIIGGVSAAVFGIGNLAAHAIRKDDLGHGKWAKYFFSGALAGFTVGTLGYLGVSGVVTLSGMPGFLGFTGKAALWGMVGVSGVNTISTSANIIGGVINSGWQGLANAGKIMLGNYYLDENKSFFGQVWEGISRHTWESPQQFAGYFWAGIRNCWADRVDYWGGATFITDFGSNTQGVTLGSLINIDNQDKAGMDSSASFDDYMLSHNKVSDEYYKHEYGHTIQSKLWGPLYAVPALCSLNSAIKDVKNKTSNHDNYWTEVWANTYSKGYYGKYFQGFIFPSTLKVKY